MIKEIDEALLQDLVKMYIESFGFSPISAKICAYLKFDFSERGITFDQLQEALGVSKSSISLNLRTLIDKGIIIEINKFNDRKTYFTYNQNNVLAWIKKSIVKMENTLDIVQRVSTLAQKDPNSNPKLLKRKQIHEELLKQNIQQFKETLLKIETI